MIMDYHILESFLKAASITKEALDDEACKLLSIYVAYTRALYLVHQQNHWQAQSYGDHLLFQRLYEESQVLADDAAERTVGLCGKLLFQGSESIISKKFLVKDDTLAACLESSLAIEKSFQDVCKNVYNTLKDKNMLSLGLDDMIMAQASNSETHIYLLQQALKGAK